MKKIYLFLSLIFLSVNCFSENVGWNHLSLEQSKTLIAFANKEKPTLNIPEQLEQNQNIPPEIKENLKKYAKEREEWEKMIEEAEQRKAGNSHYVTPAPSVSPTPPEADNNTPQIFTSSEISFFTKHKIVFIILAIIIFVIAITILCCFFKIVRHFLLPFLKKNLIIALILIMVFISFSVAEQNKATVDKLVSDTTKTFITVSVVKGAVDIIEGSTLFGIEVGDIVQPVLDYVNVIWKFLLCALAFWGCLKLFITLPSIAALALLIFSIIAYLANKAMAKYLMFCSFICSLIPFLIFGTGILMNLCTEPLRMEAQKHFENVSEIFSMADLERELSTKYEPDSEAEGFWDATKKFYNSAANFMKQTKANIIYFTNKAKEIIRKRDYIMSNMASGTWKYAVVLIMNSLIIPGLIFLFFYKLGKALQREDEKQIVVQAINAETTPKLLTVE